MRSHDKVYYKIYASPHDELIHVVEMQEFDEDDYFQDRFYVDENNEIAVFNDEVDAIDFINIKFKEEYIAPEFRRKNAVNFWRHMERD